MPTTSPQALAGRDRPTRGLALAALAMTIGGTQAARGEEPPQPRGAAVPAARPRAIPDGLNFANGLFRDRRYELAAQEYERFLKDAKPGPEAADAWYGLASARLFQGQYAPGREAYEAFLKVAGNDHPNARTAWYRIGETSYMLGDLAAARRALEAFTAGLPGHRNLETAWPYLGEVCLRMRDYPRARQAYEKALELYPEGRLADRARFGLGKTLAAQGEVDEARKVLMVLAKRGGEWADRAWLQVGLVEAGAGRYEPAAEAFATLEKVAPKSPLVAEARLDRADALMKLGRRDEAEELLRVLVAEAPHNLAAQAAFALGTSLLERDRAADALAVLDDARARFPQTTMTTALIFRSAEAAAKLGKADDARARFLKAAEADPQDPLADDALIRAARGALEARDHASAKALASSFATRFPKSPLRADARLIEARVAMVENRPKDAIALLSQSLAEDRPAPPIAEAERYYLGLAYRADGQSAKADSILDALARTPAASSAANAQYLVGQGHYEAKRYAEAVTALERYLATRPEGEVAANALTYIVWAHLEQGQTDEAARALARLDERFPKTKSLPATRLRFAWVLLESGKPADAAAAFADVLAKAPDDPLAPEAAWGRGRALDAAKKTDEAIAAYGLVAEKYAKSEQATLAAIAQARLLVESGKPGEAAAVYERYLQDHPDAKGAPKGSEPDVLLSEWGWALIDAGKTAEADRVFARLLHDHPDSSHADDARVNLAETAAQAKDAAEVLRLLSPMVAEDAKPDPRLLPTALFLAARAQDQLKKGEEAARLLDRLIAGFADFRYRREARFLRAEIALKAGDAAAAEAGFAALAAEPPAEEDPERFGAAVRRNRVQALLELKRWDDLLAAAADFRKNAPGDPLRSEVDFARGRALQARARFDEAREAYQDVIDARKGGDLAARAQLMRGETYFHQKDYQNALREYFMVDTLYDAPRWQAAALLEAGKVYEGLKRWALAAETYEGLRTKFPKDASAEEAGTRLDAARRHAQGRTDTETR